MAVTEKQVKELEDFFKNAKLPSSIQLEEGSKISNVSQFIESHLNVLRYNPDKPIYEIFYSRLLHLTELMSEKNV